MLAVGKHHRDPCLAVGLELTIGQAQGVQQFQVERVSLGHPVQPYQLDMTAPFTADTTAIRLIHGVRPRAGKGGIRRKAAA
ncbi:hypothetical protein D3C71_1636200 [compost metagenome]